MFALTHVEVEMSDNVMEGAFSIYGYLTRVLMDSGALHSFVSESFAYTLS